MSEVKKKGKGGRKRLPPGEKVRAVDVYVTEWEIEAAGGVDVIRGLFRKYWTERIKPKLKRKP